MITNKLFEEINVGDTASMERTLTKRDVDMFAVISGDMNPTHLSDEYAQMLLERQKVSGHSMWGGALISSLLGNELPGPGTVYKSQHLEFHGGLELEDTLKVSISVKEKRAKGKTIVFDCRALNQRNEKIITGIAEVLAPTKKATGDGVDADDLSYHARYVFRDLIEKVNGYDPISVAVTHPCSETALLGLIDAAKANIIEPVLVGPQERIRQLADTLNIDITPLRTGGHPPQPCLGRRSGRPVPRRPNRSPDERQSAHGRVHVGHRKKGNGSANRRTDQPRLRSWTCPPIRVRCFITDAAINIYPTLEDKVHIVKNAIQAGPCPEHRDAQGGHFIGGGNGQPEDSRHHRCRRLVQDGRSRTNRPAHSSTARWPSTTPSARKPP
jgi:phosphate acetyltransferase